MTAMNPLQSQAYLSSVSPLKAFEDLTMERELLKAVKRRSSFNQKGKRGSEFVILDAETVRSFEREAEAEDVIERKFEEHFTVFEDIEENEKLRLELSRTAWALRLYEEYKQQRAVKKKRNLNKKSV